MRIDFVQITRFDQVEFAAKPMGDNCGDGRRSLDGIPAYSWRAALDLNAGEFGMEAGETENL